MSLDQKRRNPWLMLVFLCLAYVLNFLDRQILSILAVPIKAEFSLNDEQLGLLGGLSFGLVYSLMAIPLAMIADKTSRSWVIGVSIAAWSGFTALCGLAQNYLQLFISRMGVGVGEAGGVAPSYAFIHDHFPQNRRALAIGLFSLGIPFGSALGTLYGGLMAKSFDWRMAFIFIGVIGLLFAPIFKMVVVDQPKVQNTVEQKTNTPIGLFSLFGRCLRMPAFLGLSLAAGSSSLVGYGLMFWMPSFFSRHFSLPLDQVAWILAGIMLIGGSLGLSVGGLLTDRLARGRLFMHALVPAVSFILSALFYAIAILSPTWVFAFWLLIIPQALSLMWFGPIVSAVQAISPKGQNAQVSALFLLFTNLIGLGIGPWLIGKLSMSLTPHFGLESIKYVFLSMLGFYLLAGLILFLTALNLRHDVKEGNDQRGEV